MTSNGLRIRRGSIIGVPKYSVVDSSADENGVIYTTVVKTDELIPKTVDNVFYGTKNIRSAHDSVNEIGGDYVFIRDEIGGHPCIVKEKLDDCLPIPLTEEWLVKFGFRKNPWHQLFKVVSGEGSIDVALTWNIKNKLTCLDSANGVEGEVGNYVSVPLHIDYVHQLQNLYFALTQTELEIK